MHGHTAPQDQNALGQAVGSATTFGLLISPPQQIYYDTCPVCGNRQPPAEGIAASAAYDCAAHPAVHPPWGRTTATIVAKPSNDKTCTIISRVCTHSVYVQLYT